MPQTPQMPLMHSALPGLQSASFGQPFKQQPMPSPHAAPAADEAPATHFPPAPPMPSSGEHDSARSTRYAGLDYKKAGVNSIAKLSATGTDDVKLNWLFKIRQQLTSLGFSSLVEFGCTSMDPTHQQGPQANADLFTVLLQSVTEDEAIITDIRRTFHLDSGHGDGVALFSYLVRNYVPGARGDVVLSTVQAEADERKFDFSNLSKKEISAVDVQRVVNSYFSIVSRLHPGRQATPDFWLEMILAQMPSDVRRDVEQPIRSTLSTYGLGYSLAEVSDAIGAAFERRATAHSLRSSLDLGDSDLGHTLLAHRQPVDFRPTSNDKPTCSRCSAWSCPRASDPTEKCDVYDDIPWSRLQSLTPPAYKGWVERQRSKVAKGEKPARVNLAHAVGEESDISYEMYDKDINAEIEEMVSELPSLGGGVQIPG